MTAAAAIDEIRVESNVVGKTEVNLKGNFLLEFRYLFLVAKLSIIRVGPYIHSSVTESP